MNWEQLVWMLSDFDERADKDGPLWAPVSILETGARGNNDVEAVHALVLDYDSGIWMDQALEPIRAAGLAWCGHTTHSHLAKPDCPKFRLAVPLSRPVPRADWPAFWGWASVRFPGADPACKNPGRIYYLPSHPPGAGPAAWASSGDGAPIDVDAAMLEIAQARAALPTPPPPPRAAAPGGRGDYATMTQTSLYAWAQINKARPIAEQGGEGKVWVECPWRDGHTDRKQGAKDTYLLAKGDGWPIFKCSHGHCQGHGFRDLLAAWPGADNFCDREYSPPPRVAPPPPTAPAADPPPTDDAFSDEALAALEREINKLVAPADWNPVDKQGRPAQGVNNALLYLRANYAGRVRTNEYTRLIEIDERAVDDTVIAQLTRELEVVSGVSKWGRSMLDGALLIMSAEAPKYHPIRDYLEALSWDGKERIREIPGAVIRQAKTAAIHSRYLECFFVSAVARIFQPGCKSDSCLVLQGKQAARKSSFFSSLVPKDEWFSDDMGGLDSKDAQMALSHAWIIEWAELESVRRSAVTSVKAFISRRIDKFRPPYGRSIVEYPRQCVLAGSTNEAQFLQDPTGNRRFMVVPVEFVDTDWIRRERDQLWAEAVHLWRAGTTWWLTESEAADQAAENEDLVVDDPWKSKLIEWAVPGNLPVASDGQFELTSARALEAIGVPGGQLTRASEIRVGTILTELGWTRVRVQKGGVRQYLYRKRDESDHPLIPDNFWG